MKDSWQLRANDYYSQISKWKEIWQACFLLDQNELMGPLNVISCHLKPETLLSHVGAFFKCAYQSNKEYKTGGKIISC